MIDKPLTAERALEMARPLCQRHSIYGPKVFQCAYCNAIARALLEAALAEASEEVCVCGYRGALTHPNYTQHEFLSRAEFLRREIKELEGK